MNIDKTLLKLTAILGFLTVGIGAFGAHGLQKKLEQRYADQAIEISGQTINLRKEKMLKNFETGTRYQAYHTLLILFLALAGLKRRTAYWALAGIVLFSGSLYLMALTGQTKLGMVTPIGGLCFLVAWALLFFEKLPKSEASQ